MPVAKSKANRAKALWPADAVERWPLDRLIPYARNARTHSEAQVAQIAASMHGQSKNAIIEPGIYAPIIGDDTTERWLGRRAQAACDRKQAFAGAEATLESDGRSFDEIAAQRQPKAA